MSLKLSVMPERLVVCRFEPSAPIPGWALQSSFFSLTRTTDELSIVCSLDVLPAELEANPVWRGFKLEGPFDFSQVGILLAVLVPLADAAIGIFAISTFDTDYVLVQEHDFERAAVILKLQS